VYLYALRHDYCYDKTQSKKQQAPVPIETDQLQMATASPNGEHGDGMPELTSKSTKPVRTAAVAAAAAAPAFEGGHSVNMLGAPIIDKVCVSYIVQCCSCITVSAQPDELTRTTRSAVEHTYSLLAGL
jgi:hypothetical protein